ncbi:hypothetical protein ACH4YO_08025 [Streptomyces noursei]|uniref:hypothetical protein n=1 Tax=Streptomyces noursei TaxID=1971 RepID=UPI0033F42FED
MKEITTFADDHGFDADDVMEFASEWMPVMGEDRPLYAVLESYRVMDECGVHEADTEAFMDFLALCDWDVEEAGRNFEDAHHGQWESLEEYARQTTDDHGFMELAAERGESVWLTFRDVRKFCRENDLREPEIDVAAWEKRFTLTRNGHVFDRLT